ncbi:MAG: cbb3-type cytochrome c oxidase subunit I [Candidatus Heimdallarchaeota archaeon]
MTLATETTGSRSTINQILTIIGTTNHKTIGLLYLGFSILNFLIAGLFALLIRIELFLPGPTIVSSSTYAELFSLHGTAMIFLVAMPMAAGFANYYIPTLIGAKDLYWPRWNNAAFFLLIPAGLFIYLSFLDVGWTAYPPLSTIYTSSAVELWVAGIILIGISSMAGGLNFVLTILTMRKPGLGWRSLDLFTWSIFITAIIQIIANPILTTGVVLLELDRLIIANTASTQGIFFASVSGSSPVLWQHIFWAYSHPAVYIMVLPAMGITSYLISMFAHDGDPKHVFGYTSMVVALAVIAFLGTFVWGHHLFTVGLGSQVNLFFMAGTFIIAVPSGIKTFNWLFTLYGGRIKFDTPMLFALGFLFGFTLGGITGVFLNVVPLDLILHDTVFVVGHFHLIAIGGIVSTFFGILYYLYPEATGKMYNKKLANLHFWFWTIGSMMTFGAIEMAGVNGFPRRYFDYRPDAFWIMIWNQIATIGAILMAIGVLIMATNLIQSFLKGEQAGKNPFNFGYQTDRNTT